MLALLVSSMLAAPPTLAVVVSRRVGVRPEVVAKVTGAIEDALAAEGISGVVGAADAKKRLTEQGVDPNSTCENDRMCLLGLLHLLKVDVLVAIDLGLVVDQYVLRVSAIGSEQGAPLAESGTLMKLRQLSSALPEEAQAFARSLRAALAARPARAEPLVPQPAPVVIQLPAPQTAPSRVPVIASFGVGGIALLTAFATLVGGSQQKSRLDGSYVGHESGWTRAEADGLAASANALFTASLTALLIGLVAVLVGTVLWLSG